MEYYEAVGRRKTATARVRLFPKERAGAELTFVVNERPLEEFFTRETDVFQLSEPLTVTAAENRFDISVKVGGGGMTGQAGAIRLGIARALIKADPELRPILRKGGFLTRDARIKERKKAGLRRARKAPQYTKR